MKIAIYRKLQGSTFVKTESKIACVVEAKSLDEAVQVYKGMRGLQGTPIKIERGLYGLDGWYLSVRKASNYEYENFRVIRGPGTWENLDVEPHNLPIIMEGLPETVSRWVKDMGLTWVQKSGWLFGGYYKNKEGICYYPSSM